MVTAARPAAAESERFMKLRLFWLGFIVDGFGIIKDVKVSQFPYNCVWTSNPNANLTTGTETLRIFEHFFCVSAPQRFLFLSP